jgi:hypothetical protein
MVIGAPSTLYSNVLAGSLRSTATLVPSKFTFRPIGPQLPIGLFGSVESQRPKYWIPGLPELPLLLPELLPEELLVDEPLPEEPLPLDPLLVDPLVVPLLVEPLLLVDPLVELPLADPPLVELPLVDPPLLDPPLLEPPLDDPLLVEPPFELLAPELLETPPSSAPVPPEPSPLEQNANRQTDSTANTDFATISAALDWIMHSPLARTSSEMLGGRVTVGRVTRIR